MEHARNYLTLADARRYYPVPMHRNTIFRHITQGITTRQGVVKLKATRVGGRWVTTKEAVDEFFETLTARTNGSQVEPTPSRKASIARARSFLHSLGLKD